MKTIAQSAVAASQRFRDDARHDEAHGSRTWWMTGSNFVLAYTEAQAGAVLSLDAHPDEYLVLLPDAAATIRAGDTSIEAGPDSVSIVPPGASAVTMRDAGRIVRLFSTRDAALARAAGWTGAAPGVAPLEDGPMPVGGYALRNYVLSGHITPGSPMRVFKTRNLMINCLMPRNGVRDTTRLSPHSHADFEQGSLALAGDWVHHLRHPWTADLGTWREDEHVSIDSPSMIVIPPKVVHTSRNVNDGFCSLIDVFAPPRDDFANRSVVRNADIYPAAAATTA